MLLRSLTILAILSVDASLSAADVLVGERVPPARQTSLGNVGHDAWSGLLRKYVDADGMVDYRAWKDSAESVRALDAYLAQLSAADLNAPLSRKEELAYWINAYNAVTIRGILREYPTSSIRNHTARLWGYNIWKNLKLQVDGRAVSLDQIEHEVLRPMAEPRIHFAIVCASVGCPRLLNEAYTAERLDAQLDANARDFFARGKSFRYDTRSQRVELSAILDWFGEDFGSNEAAVLRRIAEWLPNDAARRVATEAGVSVSYLPYDWGLNEQD